MKIILPLFLLFCFPQSALATQADTIIENLREQNRGFGDMVAQMELILFAGEKEKRRFGLEMKMLTLDSEVKSLMVFSRPKSKKGVALLSHVGDERGRIQWLYLPKTKRIKRISSGNRNGAFMGSEFTYEDLAGNDAKGNKYSLVKEELFNGTLCYVIDGVPGDSDSTYSKIRLWIEKEELKNRKIEFSDARGELLKTLTLDNYIKYGDKLWRAHDLHMVNHQSGKESKLISSKFQFNTGLRANEFTEISLRNQ